MSYLTDRLRECHPPTVEDHEMCQKAAQHIDDQRALIDDYDAEVDRLTAEIRQLREAALALIESEYCADGYRNISVGEDQFEALKSATTRQTDEDRL